MPVSLVAAVTGGIVLDSSLTSSIWSLMFRKVGLYCCFVAVLGTELAPHIELRFTRDLIAAPPEPCTEFELLTDRETELL